MKFRNLFDLIEDAQSITDLFDGVQTPEQAVSALERLKKHAPGVLEIVQSLRLSTEAVLEDTLEPSGVVGEGDDGSDNFDNDLVEEITQGEARAEKEKTTEVAEPPKINS